MKCINSATPVKLFVGMKSPENLSIRDILILNPARLLADSVEW